MWSFIRLVGISDLLRAEYRFFLLLIVDLVRVHATLAVRRGDVTHSALPTSVALAALRVAFITVTVHTLALDSNVFVVIILEFSGVKIGLRNCCERLYCLKCIYNLILVHGLEIFVLELLELCYEILGQFFVFALLLHFPNLSHGLPERLTDLVARLLRFSLELRLHVLREFNEDQRASIVNLVLQLIRKFVWDFLIFIDQLRGINIEYQLQATRANNLLARPRKVNIVV